MEPSKALVTGRDDHHGGALLFVLRVLATRLYKPEPLIPDGSWYVGAYQNSGSHRQRFKNLWSRLREKGGPGVEVTIRWYEGIKLRLSLDDEIAECVFLGGTFEPSQFCFLAGYLKPGMVFLDAGANNGLYSLFAAKKVGEAGQVVAFEPSDREFSKLQRNTQLNHMKNVTSLKVALGEQDSAGVLHVARLPYSGHNSLGAFGYESTPVDHEEPVEIRSLDGLELVRSLPRIDLLKIDVEGGELSLLRGATEVIGRFRPIILVELSNRTLVQQGASIAEVVELLRSWQYNLYGFTTEGSMDELDPTGHLDGTNALAVPKELVGNFQAATLSPNS